MVVYGKRRNSVLLAGKRKHSSLTMSLLDLGPVIFGGNEKIIAFLRQNRLLARIQTCTRYEIMNKNI